VGFGGPMAAALARYSFPAEHAPLVERVYRAVETVFSAADAGFGTNYWPCRGCCCCDGWGPRRRPHRPKGGHQGPCAAQGLPVVASVDTYPTPA
jgi:hypothetical protein